jgi:hypothetical protein
MLTAPTPAFRPSAVQILEGEGSLFDVQLHESLTTQQLASQLRQRDTTIASLHNQVKDLQSIIHNQQTELTLLRSLIAAHGLSASQATTTTTAATTTTMPPKAKSAAHSKQFVTASSPLIVCNPNSTPHHKRCVSFGESAETGLEGSMTTVHCTDQRTQLALLVRRPSDSGSSDSIQFESASPNNIDADGDEDDDDDDDVSDDDVSDDDDEDDDDDDDDDDDE